MASVDTFIPDGFVEGRHPVVSTVLGEKFERLGSRAGPQRVVALAADGADPAALEAFFAENVEWIARPKGVGLFEVMVRDADMDTLAQKTDLIQWLDDATRLHGQKIEDANATAVLAIHAHDAAAARAGIQEAGGRVAGQAADGSMLGSIPAARLGQLLKIDAIEAIEVTGTA